MAAPAGRTPVFRFEGLEVDLRAGELRKDGETIKLQEQPLRILTMLLEHPGEIVTREEIQRKLWPTDTFVEFDHSINAAIQRLRQALGDSAENPRCVETMARRGYRFIAPVEIVGADGGVPAVAPVSSPAILVAAMSPSPLQKRRALIFGIAMLVLAGVIAGLSYNLYRLAHRRPPARETAMKMTQLTSSGTAGSPTISPDGKYVAYAQTEQGQMSLWLYQVATGSHVQIVPPAEVRILPADVFERRKLCVLHHVCDKEHPKGVLCKVASLGGTPRKLFENVFILGNFSPDGKRLVFVRAFPERGEDDLIVANEDGSAEKLIRAFHMPEWLYTQPAWSPDGKTIAICVFNGFGQNGARLAAVSVEDGEEKTIGGAHTWRGIMRPAWLPDGSGVITSAQEVTFPSADLMPVYEISYPGGRSSANHPGFIFLYRNGSHRGWQFARYDQA